MDAASKSDNDSREGTEHCHQHNSALYRLLTDNAREMISRHAFDLTFLYASPASARVLGYTANHLVGQRLDDLVHPDDLAGVVSSFALTRDGGAPTSTTLRIRAADASWRWCEAFCRGVPNPDSGEQEIQASIHDISKYKQIEKAIERVAREWRSTFDAARDAILMLDCRATVIRVNTATTRLLDCSFVELLGQPLNDIIKERLGLDDPFDIEKAWSTGSQVRNDVNFHQGTRWLRSTVDPVIQADGQSTGAILFLADITSEKMGEIRLQETLTQVRQLSSHMQVVREEERKSIAREVHDELGHALTALKMEASWLHRKLSANEEPALASRAQSMASLIDQAIATVRRISTELRPPVLDDLGLDAALEWLTEDYQARTGIRTRVVLPEYPAQVASSQASSVFRIVQEALTNVARHAEASRVDITWQQQANEIDLKIVDNGKGFDPSTPRAGSGFGLLGMSERGRDLRGHLSIDSQPGHGTRIELRFPRVTET